VRRWQRSRCPTVAPIARGGTRGVCIVCRLPHEHINRLGLPSITCGSSAFENQLVELRRNYDEARVARVLAGSALQMPEMREWERRTRETWQERKARLKRLRSR